MTLPPSTKNGQEPKVCVKYAGPMERWNDALVTPCEGQSRRRLSPLRLSANTAMLRTACFLCVIGHRELLGLAHHRGFRCGSQGCLHFQGDSGVSSPVATTALINTTGRSAINRTYPRIMTPFTASY